VLGDLLHQLLELGVPRHEVGLAVHLDQHPDLAVVMDVVPDEAFARHAPAPLLGLRRPLLPEPLSGLIHIAAVLFERLLGVHHSDARHLAQLLHVLRGETHLGSPSYIST
jgi:hypothetical protein